MAGSGSPLTCDPCLGDVGCPGALSATDATEQGAEAHSDAQLLAGSTLSRSRNFVHRERDPQSPKCQHRQKIGRLGLQTPTRNHQAATPEDLG